jgi:hypothetical protein
MILWLRRCLGEERTEMWDLAVIRVFTVETIAIHVVLT